MNKKVKDIRSAEKMLRASVSMNCNTALIVRNSTEYSAIRCDFFVIEEGKEISQDNHL